MAKNPARLEFEELRTVDVIDEAGEPAKVVVGRLAEVRFVDVNTGTVLSTTTYLTVLRSMLLT